MSPNRRNPRLESTQSKPSRSAADAVKPKPGVAEERFLTTAQGVRLPDTDHSLKAGARGPTLLEDFHLREKIMHFDHERIPERVVHARGAAAHGVFRSTATRPRRPRARFPAEHDRETPVFVRFSTVAGSRGSADTARDVRGFAVKFYTDEGNFDLVGNNIPVFFIQDGIKFPDLIHAAKPEPDREIPQAQIRPRHVLGLRLAAHRSDPHVHVGHVGPGDPPLVPDDGGVRRPHLPPRQRRGQDHAGEVPLEAGRRHALAGLGGGPARGRHRPRLPSA